MSTNTDRTHPCFRGDPLPASAQQPDLATEVRSFMLDSQALDYPYDITPVQGKKAHLCYYVPFYQISGLGPPPADLTGTNPGDVYIDLTPTHCALYGKVADGSWKRWFDPQPEEKTDESAVKHPHFRSRKLWCTATGISWFVSNTVRRNQGRAKDRKQVSQSVYKDQETRWREASVLIRYSLAEQAKLEQQQKLKDAPKAAVAENSRRGRSATHSWSPPFETSPSPVLGKRKHREHEPDFEPEHHTSNLKKFIQHFEQGNEELAAKNSVLEQQLARRTEEDNIPESQHFNDWMGTIIRDGVGTQTLGITHKLGPSGRKYVHLEAALAAMEDQLAQEESRCEDAQLALDRAVAADEDCVRQFSDVTSQLGRTFGWA